MKYADCLSMFKNLKILDSYTSFDILRDKYKYGDKYELTFLVARGEVLMIDIHNDGEFVETIHEPTKEDINELIEYYYIKE